MDMMLNDLLILDKMNLNNLLKTFILFLFFNNLSGRSYVYSQSNTYKTRFENMSHAIEFYEDGTFIEIIKPIDILPFRGWEGEDTIAFGKYYYYKKNYYLYTSPNNKYSTLDMLLLSEEKNVDTSHLIIILNSPFESHKAACMDDFNVYKNAYFYMIKMTYQEESHSFDTLFGPYFTNNIIIPRKDCRPQSMTIYIYPYEHSNRISPWFSCLESHYSFVNRESNRYVFHIPNFKTMYAYWKRYEGKKVKRTGKNIITLDENSFLTKGGKWKINKKTQSLLNMRSPFNE